MIRQYHLFYPQCYFSSLHFRPLLIYIKDAIDDERPPVPPANVNDDLRSRNSIVDVIRWLAGMKNWIASMLVIQGHNNRNHFLTVIENRWDDRTRPSSFSPSYTDWPSAQSSEI